MTEIRTLPPCLLVSLSTSMKGNRSYVTQQLEGLHIDERGEEVSRWETTRIVADPAEYDAAIKVRNKARNLITGVCSKSAFGLLCPEDRAPRLQAAIREARALATEFNTNAKMTYMAVNIICGRVAQDDVDAVRAISSELRDLMEQMQIGLANLDVKAVREAATKARSVGQMLSVDAKRQVDDAVEAVRIECRKIVKAGEQAAAEIDAEVLATLDQTRNAFLDLEVANEVAAPDMEGRAIDLEVIEYARELGEEMAARDEAEGAGLDIEFQPEGEIELRWSAPPAPEMDIDNQPTEEA